MDKKNMFSFFKNSKSKDLYVKKIEESPKIIAKTLDDKIFYGHLAWYQQKLLEQEAASLAMDDEKRWNFAAALDRLPPFMEKQIKLVREAKIFPVVPFVEDGLPKLHLQPDEWAHWESKRLLAETNQTAALARAKSLENLLELTDATAKLLKNDVRKNFYGFGRYLIINHLPNATALHVAMAGILTPAVFYDENMHWELVTDEDRSVLDAEKDENILFKAADETIAALRNLLRNPPPLKNDNRKSS